MFPKDGGLAREKGQEVQGSYRWPTEQKQSYIPSHQENLDNFPIHTPCA